METKSYSKKCSKECAVKFFNMDEGCVNILIDEGDRLVWHDKL